MSFQVKICGVTKVEQAIAIEKSGATAIGFICVPNTPRYIEATKIRAITDQLSIDRVGVFLDASFETIQQTIAIANLNVVQIHGKESPEFCQHLQSLDIRLIKALRIRSQADLASSIDYQAHVDTLLLDAYHPNQAGGTGLTIDWTMLKNFRPVCHWWLAGGLTPDNVSEALKLVTPDGIDLSSGLENAPGDKNLERVAELFSNLASIAYRNEG